MGMPSRINKLEPAPKGFSEARGIVPHRRKATASLGTIDREGRNDGVPSGFQGPRQAGDIRRTVVFLGEEVKSRPIVPDFIRL
jgi:hypothetical protein